PGADTITQWVVNWGDGATETLTGNPSSASHVYTTSGARTISATATNEDGTFAAGNTLAVTVQDVVTSIQVGDGSAQRSLVRDITVTFSGTLDPASVDAGDFVLTGGPSGVTVTPTVLPGNTSVRLTFSGDAVVGGSLPDGSYTLTVNGAGILNTGGL